MEGEFAFIKRLESLFHYEGLADGMSIGDDCSVIPWDSSKDLLVTKDMLVEGVHFLTQTTGAFDLGVKTAEVNLSDIAAMGGRPLYAFLGMAVPATTSVEFMQDFLSGLRSSLAARKVLLLGGDTTASPDKMVFDLTVLGEAFRGQAKLRKGARTGDVVAVTGPLGDSGAGLLLLQGKGAMTPELEEVRNKLVGRHVRPQAHMLQGDWLGRQSAVHSMMDVSDGIEADSRKLAQASGTGMEIYLDSLPLSPELKEMGAAQGWKVEELALTAGEDYCLLLTVDEKEFAELRGRYQRELGTALFPIGKVTAGEHRVTFLQHPGGEAVKLSAKGFQHFAGNR